MTARLPSRLGFTLRLCLTEQEGAEEQLRRVVERDALDGLAEAARQHRVEGYVYRRLRGLDDSLSDLPELGDRYLRAAGNHLRVLADLAAAGRALDRAGITWLVVKGPVLAELLHENPGLRPYADLDLVVPGEQLGGAVAALEAAGCRTLDRNWALLHGEMKGELHSVAPMGTVIDLHWHLIHERHVRNFFRVPMADLFARARSVELNGQSVRTLDPVDTVLHLGLHTMLSGADRLLWFKDLERAVAADGDWDRLICRAEQWRAGLALGTALATARRLVAAPIPERVVRSLASSPAWRALARVAATIAPPERHLSGGSPYRALARGTRRDLPSSLAEYAKRSTHWLTNRGQVTGRHPEKREDPDNPMSMYHPTDGREAFFDAVARESRSDAS